MFEQWSGVVGTFLPLLISLILQKQWPTAFKAVVAFFACVVAATVTTALQGKLDTKNWPVSLGIIFTASMVSFQHFWKPTGVADLLETATTITGEDH